jgi:hypothetical protein
VSRSGHANSRWDGRCVYRCRVLGVAHVGPRPDWERLLAGLPSTEFAILRSHLVPADLRVGKRLHHLGQPVDRIIFPHSGVVVMTILLSGDHGGGVAVVGRDGLVGGLGAAASAPATCDADVQIAGQGWRMSALAFRPNRWQQRTVDPRQVGAAA